MHGGREGPEQCLEQGKERFEQREAMQAGDLTPAFQGLPSAIPALCTLCPQGPSRGPQGVARAGRREAGTAWGGGRPPGGAAGRG